MRTKISSNREVYNFCEPYIIAELGANHNGDMALAKRLIIAAKEAGAHCVKFQSWTKDSIFCRRVYEKNCFLKDDYRTRTDYNLERIVEEFSMSEQALLEMKSFADEIGIDCTSTPFSKAEADFLVEQIDTPFIKVASMDVNNYPFLQYLARKGRPMVISTGLSELYEIDRAIRSIEEQGNTKIVLLHCVSIYPPEDGQVNLNNIETYQKLYPYPVGFSDHTLGFAIALGAVAKGAAVIEKHFTLDKTLFGWDHKISADPHELSIICSESKRVHRALGAHRVSCEEDEERKAAFRRSIVASRLIRAGEVIKEGDLDFKRPGSAIHPEYVDFVVGRTAGVDIPFDKLIDMKDLV